MNVVGPKEINFAKHRSIKINDANYVYLEAGEGEMMLLLHGFPDNAYSWEYQIRFFSARGYRVVAPFMRGYAPTTTVSSNAFFDRATLANDLAKLVEKLNNGHPAYLISQDWGAAISYGLLSAFPQNFIASVIMAVPHPVEIKRTYKRSLKHVLRSFHWFLFQIPRLPEWIIRLSNGRFLKFLWKLWSPNFNDKTHVDQVISEMLKERGVEDSLAYYRAAFQKSFRDPELSTMFAKLDGPIVTPTKVLCGEKDMRKEMLPRQADLFKPEAKYTWELIENAGHFLHREQADKVNQIIMEWCSNHQNANT